MVPNPKRPPVEVPNVDALVVVVPKAAGLLLNKVEPATPPKGVGFVCPNRPVPVPKPEAALVFVVVPNSPVGCVACVLPKRPMVLVWGCPKVLAFPNEKAVLGVVVAVPNGLLNRLVAGWAAVWPNRPPVVVPKVLVPCPKAFLLPKENVLLAGVEPNSPVAALEVAVEAPNKPVAVAAPTGFWGPFLLAR